MARSGVLGNAGGVLEKVRTVHAAREEGNRERLQSGEEYSTAGTAAVAAMRVTARELAFAPKVKA